jgi:A/G-specific adenine glycosylase
MRLMSLLTPEQEGKIPFFQETLLKWYEENGRVFPWRAKSATNYVRIISEVLLQRTKAETVARYLPIFLKKYPSWKQLGDASEQDLVDIMKPLGLSNQRGKRMYKLAQEMKIRGGVFPKERHVVEEMSMMGQYITNAYELFILKKPAPLLDVNMSRVLERFFFKRKMADIRYDPDLQRLAHEAVLHDRTKEINWAILDFAAVQCTSQNPKCIVCLLRPKCTYYKIVQSSLI